MFPYPDVSVSGILPHDAQTGIGSRVRGRGVMACRACLCVHAYICVYIYMAAGLDEKRLSVKREVEREYT